MNFLEQLAAEWYEYSGYFVRTNIKFGKREKGGYEGEIDIAAFEPNEQKFVHIETSMDADSWNERASRFKKKFDDAAGYYDSLFPFDKDEITKIAIVGFAQNSRLPAEWPGDIEAVSIPSFVSQICQALRDNPPFKKPYQNLSHYFALCSLRSITARISIPSNNLADAAGRDAGQARHLVGGDALLLQGQDEPAALLVEPGIARHPQETGEVFPHGLEQVGREDVAGVGVGPGQCVPALFLCHGCSTSGL